MVKVEFFLEFPCRWIVDYIWVPVAVPPDVCHPADGEITFRLGAKEDKPSMLCDIISRIIENPLRQVLLVLFASRQIRSLKADESMTSKNTDF